MDYNNPEFFIEHLGTIDSTNNFVRSEAVRLWSLAGDAKAVVVYADAQTAGRGQRGNAWQAQAGANLLMTIMVCPVTLPVVSQFALSQAVALSVRTAMGYLGIDTMLKWPNDIYVANRKLAGILVELDYSGSLVEQAIIGVGLNVNQEQFADMDKIPVSMKMLTGEIYSIDEVLAVLLDSFSYYYSLLEKGDYTSLAADYKRHLLGCGKVMRYRDGVSLFDATIVGVEGDGRICLRRADGAEALYAFKEVELVI